jgi:hypothetical protein
METRTVPAWLQQQNETLASAIAVKQEQLLNGKIIKADTPQYWSDLRAELKLVAESLSHGLVGRFHHSNFDTSRSEDHCRLEVSFIGNGTSYRNSYTDLRYRPETQEFWYKSSLGGEKISLVPCVIDGRIHVISEQHPEPMDAEAAAEMIAKPMVRHAMSGALVTALS